MSKISTSWYNSDNCEPGSYDYKYRWHNSKTGEVKRDCYGRARFLRMFKVHFGATYELIFEHSERGHLIFFNNYDSNMVHVVGWWNREYNTGSIRTFKDQLKNIYRSWNGANVGAG